jgi:hypothetical protein
MANINQDNEYELFNVFRKYHFSQHIKTLRIQLFF